MESGSPPQCQRGTTDRAPAQGIGRGSRTADDLDSKGFLRLIQSYAGQVDFTDDEKAALVRRIKPLLKSRELTEDEQKELVGLFDRYRMRLSSKLNRSIGAALESEFGPDES